MIDQPFRNMLPQFTGPLIRVYQQFGLTPNHITLGALGLALIATLCTAAGWTWLALFFWWVGRLFDGTDGIYARATQQATPFGAFLDIVCDMASYSMMLFGFGVLYPEIGSHWQIMMFLYVLCITGALSLGAIEREQHLASGDNRGIRLAAGLAEGGETGIAYTLFLLFPAQINWLAKLWILVLLTTVVARAVLAKRILSQTPSR